MKKFIAIFVMLCMLISLTACGNDDAATGESKDTNTEQSTDATEESKDTEKPEEGSKSEGGKTIGLSMNALDEYQTEWSGYFKEYAEGLGYEVIMTNAEGKVDKQLADVESLIQRKPDVILIRSADFDGVASAFEACEKAGIPTIDSDFGTSYEDTLHLSSSQLRLGAMQGEWCNDWLDENPDETLKVGYIWGVQGSSATQDRYDGWKNAVEENNKDRLEILTEKVCNWSANESMAAVEDWIQAYPDMNTIVAMSDEMAIAAVNVVQAANKADQIKVLGLDGSPNGQKCIKDGTLAGTSFIPRRSLAEKTVDYAIEVINGDHKKGEKIDIGDGFYAFLTKENIEAEMAKYE